MSEPDAAPDAAPDASPEAGPDTAQAEYRVLARKYRPQTFKDLIGQDAMVRTLSNALASGRLAHAFVLTGVRGIGKTTTARIIAKGLNCIGPDGTGEPTTDPCGVCENCLAIAEDRHVDVMEMDAASRTGVDDIREVIEGVRYRPVAARYKIYIIDEVHMLSRNAFNALLKTLEEPPEHVKFIFATTEIRKVPITVLSRCQRFDLRRLDGEMLSGLFKDVCEKEAVEAEDEALALIARAADGSARDGLSLLDQAMALASGPISQAQVQDMLGMADRGQVFDLFEEVMAGQIAKALKRLREMHDLGADPLAVTQDLMELTHLLTRIRLSPDTAAGPGASEIERVRGKEMAEKLTVQHLGRAWQMLLKGLSEVQQAPSALAALEMILVRLAHASELPTPGDLARMTAGGAAPATTASPPPVPAPTPEPSPVAETVAPPTATPSPPPVPEDVREMEPPPPPPPLPSQMEDGADAGSGPPPDFTLEVEAPKADPQNFGDIVGLFEVHRDILVHTHLMQSAHLIQCEPGRLILRLDPGAPSNLTHTVANRLREWTGEAWLVDLGEEEGAPTLAEQVQVSEAATRAEAASDPVVAALLETFPGASIEAVRGVAGGEPDPIADAPPDDDGDDDGDDEDDDELTRAREA